MDVQQPPSIIGVRPNLGNSHCRLLLLMSFVVIDHFLIACIGTPIGKYCSSGNTYIFRLFVPLGVLVNETVIAQVGCSGKTIDDFTTSSPVGMTKTSIANPSTGMEIVF